MARRKTKAASRTPSVPSLRRELARLAKALKAERTASARARRASDRRLAAVVAELAALRHHEARAQGLERLLAEREASLAGLARRIAELEGRLLLTPTELG